LEQNQIRLVGDCAFPVIPLPYAPDLNPTEYVWMDLKYHRMANYAATNVMELAKTARRHCRKLQRTPHLLFACLRHSGLFLTFDRA